MLLYNNWTDKSKEYKITNKCVTLKLRLRRLKNY